MPDSQASYTDKYAKTDKTPQHTVSQQNSGKRQVKETKINGYLQQHIRALFLCLGQLMRTPLISSMTIIVIGIAIALPAGLFVLLQNVQNLSHGWDNSTQISLYLNLNTTTNQTQNLLQQIRSEPGIASIHYISPQQGLAEFKQSSDFGNALAELKSNPLPAVIVVQPALSLSAPAAINQLLNTLKQLPSVQTAQLDMQWVKRLYSMINLGKRSVYILAFLLGLGVLLIIGNTINLITQNYRKQIEIYKLVGATDAFVRRPFLYMGMFYGLLGSIVAWWLTIFALWWLEIPVDKLAQLYGSKFHLSGLSFHAVITLLIISTLLGLLGSWVAVQKHLNAS